MHTFAEHLHRDDGLRVLHAFVAGIVEEVAHIVCVHLALLMRGRLSGKLHHIGRAQQRGHAVQFFFMDIRTDGCQGFLGGLLGGLYAKATQEVAAQDVCQAHVVCLAAIQRCIRFEGRQCIHSLARLCVGRHLRFDNPAAAQGTARSQSAAHQQHGYDDKYTAQRTDHPFGFHHEGGRMHGKGGEEKVGMQRV